MSEKNKTVILTGMMGAGKSTIGSILSEILNLALIDLDNLIEKKANISIPEIFKIFGEEKFRELETSAISSLEDNQNMIISTGGGIIENKKNIGVMKEKGKIYYLKAPYEILYDRIKNETNRPLLMTPDPKKTIKELLEKRRQNYECADFIIDTENRKIKEIADEIIKIYEKINS